MTFLAHMYEDGHGEEVPATQDGQQEATNGQDAEMIGKDTPMKAELKHLDRKRNEKNHYYYVETIDEPPPEQVDWWQKYALCVTRYMKNDNKTVQQILVQINSQHLKDLLKTTIRSYPGLSFDTKDVTISQPCRVLYHYRNGLEKHAEKLKQGSEASNHAKVLLNYIQAEFGETIQEADNLREQGIMSYQHLWTLFKPGSVVFARVFDQTQAFKVQNYQYVESTPQGPGLHLSLQYVDFDGKKFGTRSTSMMVPAFAGTAPINRLNVIPQDFQPSVQQVKQRLIARGRKFEKHAGMHFASHSGIAIEHTPGCAPPNLVHVDGRVVIDCATYHRLNANFSFSVSPFESSAKVNTNGHQNDGSDDEYCSDDEYYSEEDEDMEDFANGNTELLPTRKLELKPLSDEQCMMTNAMVRGFSFTEKKFLDFFIDYLTPIEWNEQCFDQLVLADRQKRLIQALVAEHITNKSEFDDIVKGKGKGLVMVLHGPPGVGKTLTAECVAEECKRPLYVVSSGDLGTESETLDTRLSRILDMASTWRAVLLIDEADVFLERRSLHDMQRNALVSIFLRVLEYYQGILFLTSNRVDTFDDAFKSRIHVPLKYNGLDAASRKQIWKNFLDRVDAKVDHESFEKLAAEDLNGRQIKGIVRTATSLANYDKKPLDYETLEQVIAIQKDFERDLNMG